MLMGDCIMSLRPALADDRGARCCEVLLKWASSGEGEQSAMLWGWTAFLQSFADNKEAVFFAVCKVANLLLKDG